MAATMGRAAKPGSVTMSGARMPCCWQNSGSSPMRPGPTAIWVGKFQSTGSVVIGMGSNNFEITLQFPVAHMLSVLRGFPLPASGKVVDKGITK